MYREVREEIMERVSRLIKDLKSGKSREEIIGGGLFAL